MFREIRIEQLGIIDEVTLTLGPGLTVISGETGAGKTMLVSALGLLVGGRADTTLVRAGARRAVVTGIAALARHHPARRRAVDAGADDSDDDLVLVRVVEAAGRSRAHVGGVPTPVGVLTEVGDHLVAVHGQADQWRLRHADQHRDLLDAYAGEPVTRARAAYETAYGQVRQWRADLDELTTRARERALEAETLTQALRRIERVDPQPGEDQALAGESQRLEHLGDLRGASAGAATLLSGSDEASGGSDPGILGAFARVQDLLDRAAPADPALGQLALTARDLGYALTELAADVHRYADGLEDDPGRLEQVQQRRSELGALTRLYGQTIDDVLAWGAQASVRLSHLLDDDDRIEGLRAQLAAAELDLAQRADALTRARRTAADRLSAAVTEELLALDLPHARVEVSVREGGGLGPNGRDEVQIGLSANLGSPVLSVVKAASGGELSRVMLAIKTATASAVAGPAVFVFDEVDAGIGGAAALAVGARLAALARHAQVLVVTHLAQVAAHADTHVVVRKTDDGQVTRSGVHVLTAAERVHELARMLGGTDSDAARDHARDLLRQVQEGTP